MTLRDPSARRASFAAWAIAVLLLLSLPAACHYTQAQDATRADGPPEAKDVYCSEGWCAIRQDTLRTIITALQKMSQERTQLRELCGWKER